MAAFTPFSACWAQNATLSLIEIYRNLEAKDVKNVRKWSTVSQKLKEKGFNYSLVSCKKKWENLTRRYKEIKIRRKGVNNSEDEEEDTHEERWPYYYLMDDIYNHRQHISPPLSFVRTPPLANQLPPNTPIRIIKLPRHRTVWPNSNSIIIKGSPKIIDVNTSAPKAWVVDNTPHHPLGPQAKAPHEAKSTPVTMESCPLNNDLNTITSEPFIDDTFPISSHLDPEQAVPTPKATLSQGEFRAELLGLLRTQERKLDKYRIEQKERLEELQKIQEEELKNSTRLVQIFENYCGNSTKRTN